MCSNNVVVTGFGPFGDHHINASWAAVKLLPNSICGNNIIIEEIPVLYNHITQRVPVLWKEYRPKLMVHVGVSSFAKELTIETCANRQGYLKLDASENEHPTGECCDNGSDCIMGSLDMEQICDYVNNAGVDVKACTSRDAGRYLCEFIYYHSLNINKERTLFIHVPPLENPYTAKQLAIGITQVIEGALQQMCSSEMISKY